MKRTISFWLGLLAFAALPVFSQAAQAQQMGKIHGTVIGPTGAPESEGTVNLSPDGGRTLKYIFKVNPDGTYSGEAPVGSYTFLFRLPDTPPGKMVDQLTPEVKIVTGQDIEVNDDMTRKEFIDALPAETRKQLEEIKQKNAEAIKANTVIKAINGDIKVVVQDFKEANEALQTAVQALGSSATRAQIEAKEAEIRQAKYNDAESLMLKDTKLKPDASVLWAQLGEAQVGLKKYDDAEASYKKALEIESTAKKPNLAVQAASNAGLGEIYARTGKVADAETAYDAAAKLDPMRAGFYLRNEAVIYAQMGNGDAQVTAADKAITADPTQALPYYLKGQGLIQKATVDPKSGKMILPPGCAEAYEKYLELAPNGQFVNDVKGILAQANTKIETTYEAPKKKR